MKDQMKRCSYCGKEYPDDATLCFIDEQPLVQPSAIPSSVQEDMSDVVPGAVCTIGGVAPARSTAEKDRSDLVFPDYQSSARDAWKCVGMILVFEVVLSLVVSGLDSRFHGLHKLHRSGFGFFFMHTLYSAIFILTAAYFARTESFASFVKAIGLDRKPSDYVWFGVVCALGLRFIAHFIVTNGWMKGYANYDITEFRHTAGPDRYFYLLPLLLAAFFEEPVFRGFLYKAFRRSYSTPASTILIVAFTAGTHWTQYYHSMVAVIDLSTLAIVQCYLREKSDSLWDCIFCHLAYNASIFIVAGFRV
jgi:membrane protease YdiL (CAAX protease family)